MASHFCDFWCVISFPESRGLNAGRAALAKGRPSRRATQHASSVVVVVVVVVVIVVISSSSSSSSSSSGSSIIRVVVYMLLSTLASSSGPWCLYTRVYFVCMYVFVMFA